MIFFGQNHGFPKQKRAALTDGYPMLSRILRSVRTNLVIKKNRELILCNVYKMMIDWKKCENVQSILVFLNHGHEITIFPALINPLVNRVNRMTNHPQFGCMGNPTNNLWLCIMCPSKLLIIRTAHLRFTTDCHIRLYHFESHVRQKCRCWKLNGNDCGVDFMYTS